MPPAQAEEKRNDYNELVTLQNLQRVFDNLDKKCDKKIDSEELYEYLRFLGFRCNMTNVKDLIWEVDEDSDGCLSWHESKRACLCLIDVFNEHVPIFRANPTWPLTYTPATVSRSCVVATR